MRRSSPVALALIVGLGVATASSTAASSETGVTAHTITIGATVPLTGPASAYGTIPAAMKAYFAYINSRKGPDGKRGVYGRQIVFKFYDDGFNPANSVQLTRKLVEEDRVFAIVSSIGTEVNLSVRPYLNQRKVPQILSSTGASTWGRDAKQYPWTGGWVPDYISEGTIYGQSIARNSPKSKIAVIYQNDDYGKDYLEGLERGLGAKTSNIVAKEPYEVTTPDVRAQIGRLKASGATIFVILATPKFTIQSYVFAKALGWDPPVTYTNSVSGTDTILSLAQKAGGGALVNSTVTTQYAKDPADPSWDSDEAMKLYKQVLSKFAPSLKLTDALNMVGVGQAHAFTQLLYKAGKNPTRDSLMRAYRNWNEPNPFLLPDNLQQTSGADQFPIDCQRLVRFQDGRLKPVSKLKCVTRGAA
jgi:branched-chain amino acid transport system substrate-binding protein